MNSIYTTALEAQGSHGKPIFLTNISLCKLTKFGASKRLKREYFKAKKIVAAGTIEQIKNDPRVLLSALVQILGKPQALKADRTKYIIDEEIVNSVDKNGNPFLFKKTEAVEFISFHGYSMHK